MENKDNICYSCNHMLNCESKRELDRIASILRMKVIPTKCFFYKEVSYPLFYVIKATEENKILRTYTTPNNLLLDVLEFKQALGDTIDTFTIEMNENLLMRHFRNVEVFELYKKSGVERGVWSDLISNTYSVNGNTIIFKAIYE